MVDRTLNNGEGTAAFDTAAALLACETTLNSTPGVILVGMPEGMGTRPASHTVYNFEVEGTHKYVADGIRVHNKSVLSFVGNNEILTAIGPDGNGDGAPDWYKSTLKNGKGTVEARPLSVDETTGTATVAKIYRIDRDGSGITELTVENVYGLDENGDPDPEQLITSDIVDANLKGSRIGEATLQSLTPFLSRALLGDDATLLENVAADTLLGFTLGKFGDLAGGIIDIGLSSFLQDKTGVNAEGQSVIEQLAEDVFFDENIGGDLLTAGVENALSAINQLIMAEIFEFIDVDGVPGAITEALGSASINELLSKGLESQFFQDLLPDNSALKHAVNSAEIRGFPSGPEGWVNLIVGKVIQEILPGPETEEGALAAGIASALLPFAQAINGFGMFTHPVVLLAAFVVGEIFDSLFDKDPQAWTNVGFDSETGRFKVLNTWQDDGGNTELSRSLAEAYVVAINDFIDIIDANSHNYGELARKTFGHLENSFKNAGVNGKSFGDFQSTYIDAFVNDMATVELNDGKMAAVRALEALEVPRLRQEYRDFGSFKGVLDLAKAMEDPSGASFTLGTDPNMPRHLLDGFSLTWTENQSYEQRFKNFIYSAVAAKFSDPVRNWEHPHDPYIPMGSNPIPGITRAIPFFSIKERPVVRRDADLGGSYVEPWEKYLYSTSGGGGEDGNPGSTFYPLRVVGEIADISSQQDILDQFGIEEAIFYNDKQIYNMVISNLQIAHDYHNYLENTEITNDLILAAEGTNASAAWIQTLALAEELGLADPYDLTGDEIDNVFYTADGDDVVRGESGDDFIKTYGGDDEIHGGGDHDTIYSGNGNDVVRGGIGADRIWAGNGNDVVTGGDGADWVRLGKGNDVFHDNAQSNENGNDTVFGDAGDDFIYGGGGADIFHGNDGRDTINGGDGNDTIYGGLRSDTIDAGAGADQVWGGMGSDTVYLRSGSDVFHDDEQNDSNGADLVYGGNGDDTINGGGGADEFHGQSGHDTISGGDGDDILAGGEGNDKLTGGSGADTLKGGDGLQDVASYETSTSRVFVNLAAETASGGDAEGDTLTGIEGLIGSDQADQLTGDTLDNEIDGGGGQDDLVGGAGNDVIRGGTGYDDIDAGDGNDEVWGGNGADTVTLGAGNDTFYDTDQTDEHGADTVNGGWGHDVIDGGGGDDRLIGGGGNDTIIGGIGNDTLKGGLGADVFRFNTNLALGVDVITDFELGIDLLEVTGMEFSDLTFIGTGSGVRVEWDSGSVRLEDVSTSSIDADSFLFL